MIAARMGEDVRVPMPGGGTLPAALAIPDGPGPHPGVLVIHEVFGLNDDMRIVTDRLAGAGYAAIAPDLLSAGNRVTCVARLLAEVARSGRGRAVAQLGAAHRWLGAHERVAARRLAVIGFCPPPAPIRRGCRRTSTRWVSLATSGCIRRQVMPS
ncbi:MAG: hypothetical protein E6J45_01125 [Chloroflexi bacterium]|nr:MAG: hypothetical protein E6J45_01125 [Chloroflexota bacterium]